MEVIPAINETNFEEIKKKIKSAQDFGAQWAHLDVADGKFAPNFLWNNPSELQASSVTRQVKIEVHLMVKNPEEVIGDWIWAGAKRLIIHVETLTRSDLVNEIRSLCDKSGVELVLAAKPGTSIDDLLHLASSVQHPTFLILAVNPGLSGQKFQEDQLEKISGLRRQVPQAVIEVDGGVNLENASAIKSAGANILIAASYIWNSEKPAENYRRLTEIFMLKLK